jgi:hypothetical protein
MSSKWRLRTGAITVALALVVAWRLMAGGPNAETQRQALYKAIDAGNYKDAYQGLRKLALDPADDPLKVGTDLTKAIFSLERLGRVDEIDAFREAVITAHKSNWRLLSTAARSFTDGQHYGFIVAGKFNRGNARGQGRYVNALKRDRVRALQLFQQALPLVAKDNDKEAAGEYYLQFARALLNGGGLYEPWRLQYLSDLSQLPDYEEGYRGSYLSSRGAPVDDKGNPILYALPKTYQTAGTDGQRWRWLLAMAAEANPALLNQTDMIFADFMRSQLGVQTMAQFGFGARVDTDTENKSGTYARRYRHREQERHLRAAHAQRRRDHRPSGDRHPPAQGARRVQLDQDLRAHRRTRQVGPRRAGARQAVRRVRGSPAVCQGVPRLAAGDRGVRARPKQLPPAAARPDREQLGPFRASHHAGRGQVGRRRFPLPQRQQGDVRGPRHPRWQAAR